MTISTILNAFSNGIITLCERDALLTKEMSIMDDNSCKSCPAAGTGCAGCVVRQKD